MGTLLYRFAWVLPGHGHSEMHRDLEHRVEQMRR